MIELHIANSPAKKTPSGESEELLSKEVCNPASDKTKPIRRWLLFAVGFFRAHVNYRRKETRRGSGGGRAVTWAFFFCEKPGALVTPPLGRFLERSWKPGKAIKAAVIKINQVSPCGATHARRVHSRSGGRRCNRLVSLWRAFASQNILESGARSNWEVFRGAKQFRATLQFRCWKSWSKGGSCASALSKTEGQVSFSVKLNYRSWPFTNRYCYLI